MRVSQVAVSRQITILEDYLGVQLFERSSKSVKLTDAGRVFSEEIAALFDGIENATHRVLSNEKERTINFRSYPTVARYWVMPRLHSFAQRYPEYRVRFDTKVEPLDFRGTYLDVALQLGRGDWKNADCCKLREEVIDVVCSPEYAQRHDYFKSEESRSKAMLLYSKYRRREWTIWTAEVGLQFNDDNVMDFDTSLLAYGAAEQGLGLAIGQLALLQEQFDKGTLVRPFDKPVQTDMAFYVVWPTMNSIPVQSRRFIDWLLESSGKEPVYFRKP